MVKEYEKIIINNPDIYTRYSEIEMSREQYVSKVHTMLRHYFFESLKIAPMSETLTDIERYGLFIGPISNFNEDIGVKFTVGLQLAYKTIEVLGTEK